MRRRRARWLRVFVRIATNVALSCFLLWAILSAGVIMPLAIGHLLTKILSPFLGAMSVQIISIAAMIGTEATFIGMVISSARYHLRKRRESNRVLAGLCRKCGYDVRENADRCPECGAVIVRRPTPKMPNWD